MAAKLLLQHKQNFLPIPSFIFRLLSWYNWSAVSLPGGCSGLEDQEEPTRITHAEHRALAWPCCTTLLAGAVQPQNNAHTKWESLTLLLPLPQGGYLPQKADENPPALIPPNLRKCTPSSTRQCQPAPPLLRGASETGHSWSRLHVYLYYKANLPACIGYGAQYRI